MKKIYVLLSVFCCICIPCQLFAQACSAPVINSFSPTTGYIGSKVTIIGANFDPIPANNQVFFGATQATVVSASFGKLEVIAPAGATYAPVSVRNACGLIGSSTVPFNGIFCGTTVSSSTYNTVSYTKDVSGGYQMLSQDMDLDGKPDLLVCGFTTNKVSVMRNLSTPNNFSFAPKYDLVHTGATRCIAPADYDGDGKIDLAVVDDGIGGVRLWLNTSVSGSLSFTQPPALSGIGGYQCAAGDLNNDGKIDLVVGSGSTVRTFMNTSTLGNISFVAKATISIGGFVTGLIVGDVDGDGVKDIGTANANNNVAIAVRNTTSPGSSTFSFGAVQSFATGLYPYRLFIGDFDKDGKIDFVTNNFSGANTSVFRNTSTIGNISFSPASNLSSPSSNYRLGVGDVDGDGKPDLVTKSSGENVFSVYKNISNGPGNISFDTRIDYPGQAEVSGIVIADLDGDYVPDISTSGTSYNTLRVHRNLSTVVDNTPPNAICKNITVPLSPEGLVTITADMVDNGSSDACGLQSILINGQPSVTFTCANVGDNVVTLKVADRAGNVSTCQATVTIAQAAVTAVGQTTVCQGQTVTLKANQGDSYQWNRDGVDIPGATNQTYIATETGDYSVTVTNASGCSGTSAPTKITVNNNPTVSITPSGNASLCTPGNNLIISASTSSIYQWKLNGSDIPGATQQNYTAIAAGTYSVKVVDLFGCSATSDPLIVSATDNILPVAKCKNATVVIGVNGTATITTADINNGSSDNCGIASITLNGQTTFSCADVGKVIEVNLVVKDNNNNTSVCAAQVTVTDPNKYCNKAPIAVCKPVTISANGNCQGSALANEFDGGSTDADGDALTFSVSPAGPYAVGTTNVTLTVTDTKGASTTCTTNVTVEDKTPPAINGPSPITVNNDPDKCGAVVNYTAPTATDNCIGESGSQTFPYVGQIVNWTVPTNVTHITITALGARGGNSNGGYSSGKGGKGASIKGDFLVAPGDVLKILVGGHGEDVNNNYLVLNTGGGGGTFVWKNNTAPLIAAGGGSGLGTCGQQPSQPGLATLGGTGSGGLGGSANCGLNQGGGGGAGWLSNGGGTSSNLNIGGYSPLNGGAGGAGGIGGNGYIGTAGGFGGGAGGGGNCGGPGGGGGYTGGSGGDNIICSGGQNVSGGKSFNQGSNQTNTSAVNDGDGQVIISWSANSATITQTSGLPSGSLFPIGKTTNAFEATDAAGNKSTYSFDVTVTDNQKPIITTNGNKNVSNDAGVCGALVTVNASASDNCSVGTPTGVRSDGLDLSDPYPVGTTTITWNVTDVNNNAALPVTQTVTVNDTEKPTVTAGTISACYLDLASAQAAAVDATTYKDNCTAKGDLKVSVSTSGTCTAVITVTVTDASHNSRSVSYNTKIDNTAPVLSDMPANVPVSCSNVPNAPTITALDNCDGSVPVAFTESSTKGSDPSNGNYYNYKITRTWSAQDGCGNQVSHTQIITVEDKMAPTFTRPVNTTVYKTGECSYDVSVAVTGDVTDEGDNCATGLQATYTDVEKPGACAGSLLIERTWHLIDPSGNAAGDQLQLITVLDNTPPTVTTVAGTLDRTLSCSDAAGIAAALALAPTASDNCSTATPHLISDVTTPGCGTTYTQVRTWNFTDACGNASATYVQTITVKDETAPIISTVAGTLDRTVECSDAQGIAAAKALVPQATDNCTAVTVHLLSDVTTPGCGSSYVEVRKWNFTDACNNTSGTFTQTITVRDQTAPTLSTAPSDVTVSCDNIPGKVSLTATDNCDQPQAITATEVSTKGSDPSKSNYYNYTITRTWTATDACGNTSSKQQVITVQDIAKPVVLTKPVTIYLNAAGTASIAAADVDNGSNDNCSPVSLSVSKTAFNCSNVGANTVTLTVTDISGNSDSKTAVVTVVDNTTPTITAPAGFTVNADAGKCYATISSLGTPTTWDNCSFTVSNNAPATFPVGNTVVTWTIKDASNNTATATQTIVVKDNQLPNVLTQNITRALTSAGTVTITALDINNVSTDNCGIKTYELDKTTFDCTNIGANTVTLTVTDVNGNQSSKTATVTITAMTTTATVSVSSTELPTQQFQYSDPVTFTATLTPGQVAGNCAPAASVTFKVGSQPMGTAPLALNSAKTQWVATLPANLLELSGYAGSMSPGAKTVTAIFNSVGAAFGVTNPTTTMTINPEDADVTYTGNVYFTLPSASATSMNVPVTDLVKDITALGSSAPKYDGFKGDISKANVTFSVGTADAKTVPVVLLSASDQSTGTANASYTIPVSTVEATAGGKSITVNSKAGAYYQNPNGVVLPQVVTIATPGTGFVSGGGFFLTSAPAGQLAPAIGDRTNFGFTMQYTKSGSNLKGQCNIILRSKGKIYQIKSTAINTLSIDNTGLKGYFNTKANITDITDPLNPKSAYDLNGTAIGGGLDLTVWLNDVSQGGNGDQVAIQLFNGSQLVYSSNWISGKTTLQNLGGGNISVRTGTATALPPAVNPAYTGVEVDTAVPSLTLAAYPNPSRSLFTLQVLSNDKQTGIHLRVLDIAGRSIEQRQSLKAGQTVQTGAAFRPGVYIVEVVQGQHKATLKLVKTSE